MIVILPNHLSTEGSNARPITHSFQFMPSTEYQNKWRQYLVILINILQMISLKTTWSDDPNAISFGPSVLSWFRNIHLILQLNQGRILYHTSLIKLNLEFQKRKYISNVGNRFVFIMLSYPIKVYYNTILYVQIIKVRHVLQ